VLFHEQTINMKEEIPLEANAIKHPETVAANIERK
jgi:hypothetical protein